MPFKISRIGRRRGLPVELGFGKCGAITRRLSVGQIGLVSGDNAAMLSSCGWRPHGESKLVSRNPLESPRPPMSQSFQKLPLTRAEGIELGH